MSRSEDLSKQVNGERRLRGVAVGAGYFSQFHFDAWSRLANVDLCAICDVNSSAAQAAAQQYQVPQTYADYGEMLDREQPDFVDIITRPDSHLPLLKQAAERGVAVICQKPLTPSLEESQQLVAVAEEAGIPLMVHENFRFQPWYREMKRLMESGLIGDQLHSISVRTRTGDGWQPDAYMARQPYFREMPKFLIFETGVHFIDTFRYLAGEIESVYASLRTLNPDIVGEDAGTVLFEFAGGCRGIWDANRFNEPNCENPRYTFGDVLVEGNGGSILLYPDGRLSVQPLGKPESDHAYAPSTQNFAGDCVYATQAHFVECLLAGDTFETSGANYLKTLQVQEAVYQSADSGLPVRGICKEGFDASR